MGPFRIDSAICRAAFVAGVIGDDGGDATLIGEPSEPDFVPFGAIMRRTFCFEGEHPAPNPLSPPSLLLHPSYSPSLYSRVYTFVHSAPSCIGSGSCDPGLVRACVIGECACVNVAYTCGRTGMTRSCTFDAVRAF